MRDEFKRIDFTLDIDLLEDFDKCARLERMGRSAYLRTLMLKAIREHEEELRLLDA